MMRCIDEALIFKLLDFLNISDKNTFNELFDNGIMYYDTYFHFRNGNSIQDIEKYNILKFLLGNSISARECIQLYITKDKLIKVAEILNDAGYVVKLFNGSVVKRIDSM